MNKTLKNIYLFAVIIMLLNPARITAQNTYSGSYSIINLLTPGYESGSKINGIAKYNYIEKNERRIYHGPFKFSTTENPNPGDFIPELIDLPTDSITISGLFNQGKKNGLWKIQGYGSGTRTSRISIEMIYDNGVLDGTVKGSSSQNSTEICSFNYSFSKGKLNGPFRITNDKIDYHGYGYPKINCLLNFTDGLFDGNNTISFFNDDNKEFKLLRQYDHGLLYQDKFQDLSSGEYIINKKYNIDFTLPDFNYTNYWSHYEPYMDKYLSGKVPAQNYYKNFFTLLSDISIGTANEVPYVGYFLTKNSEIFSLDGLGTVERAVAMGNHQYSYLSDKDKFIRETSPKDLWSNIYLDADEKQRGHPFVDNTYFRKEDGTVAVENDFHFLTQVNDHIFDLLNLIFIFPLGQDTIEIKPIKEPYIFVSQEAEELYTSYRTKYLYMDSINGFKQDSLRFRSEIINLFSSLNSDEPTLHRQLIIYYFKHGIRFGVEEMENALTRQFQKIKKIDQEISDQSNFKFSSEDLRIKQDSIFHHYQGFQIRLKHLNKILSIRDNPDLLFILSPNATTASLKFQSQIQKLLEIPGANERFSDDRQFTFRPDQSTEDELNEILLIINERNEVYSKIYKNEIRVNPKKYATIDEFVTDLKTM